MPCKDKAHIAAYKRQRKLDPEAKAKDNAYRNEWRKRKRASDPERAREYDREYYQKRRKHFILEKTCRQFGITKERYYELLELCGNRCEICHNQFGEDRTPHVDHCHKTGVVRGMLCRGCNISEGYIGTIENAERLLAYMRKHQVREERYGSG